VPWWKIICQVGSSAGLFEYCRGSERSTQTELRRACVGERFSWELRDL
jgi:hypothetical protein